MPKFFAVSLLYWSIWSSYWLTQWHREDLSSAMEPEGSIPHSQEPASDSHAKLFESSPHPTCFFKIHFNIFRVLKWLNIICINRLCFQSFYAHTWFIWSHSLFYTSSDLWSSYICFEFKKWTSITETVCSIQHKCYAYTRRSSHPLFHYTLGFRDDSDKIVKYSGYKISLSLSYVTGRGEGKTDDGKGKGGAGWQRVSLSM
jgi:hypothetical protein